MNARYSPLVTEPGGEAERPRGRRWCRGPSLSNAKPGAVVADPTARRPGRRSASRAARGRGPVGAGGCAVDRAERVQPEGVLQVGEDQLLVLLLVVQPELDERGHRPRPLVSAAPSEQTHPLIDRARGRRTPRRPSAATGARGPAAASGRRPPS